ncbi:MAG: YbaN family protein [Actinomycetota bacterium]|nr:YbaN family protein [Actinomycetota bacterium]
MTSRREDRKQPITSGVFRIFFLCLGFIFVGLGFIGILIPGMPTTVFMIMAASCFAKSSPRFERWVLELPMVGSFVQDYRSGLGMPRKSKAVAITMMTAAVSLSALFAITRLGIRLIVVAVGIIGVWYVGVQVPTREKVLAKRAAEESN